MTPQERHWFQQELRKAYILGKYHGAVRATANKWRFDQGQGRLEVNYYKKEVQELNLPPVLGPKTRLKAAYDEIMAEKRLKSEVSRNENLGEALKPNTHKP